MTEWFLLVAVMALCVGQLVTTATLRKQRLLILLLGDENRIGLIARRSADPFKRAGTAPAKLTVFRPECGCARRRPCPPDCQEPVA